MQKADSARVFSLPHRLIVSVRYRWPEIILILILIVLPFLFFWRLVTPNPADRMHIAAGDFTGQYFPLRAFVAQEWVQGRIPLWNPYLYGGQPALADIQSGALYPPHLIEALILGWGRSLFGLEIGFPLWALELQVIAHFSLAAVGTYLFARHVARRSGVPLRRARFAGFIASLVFAYGGYLTGFPVQQLTILEVSAWLPWVLWGLSVANGRMGESTNHESRITNHVFRFIRPLKPALRPAAWTALAFAMAILAGHPQTVLYIFYLTLAYTLFFIFYLWRNQLPITAPPPPRSPAPRRTLLQLLTSHMALWLFTIMLGAAIAAAQLLPTIEFIRHSLRADLSYQAAATGLPLNEFISILYPGFFGGSPQYVGIASLVLIGLGLTLARPRAEVYFWAGVGLVGFVLAFGGNTFLYSFFYLLVPGFEAIRQQERAFLLYSFSAAMLAGLGAVVLAGPLSKSTRQRYLLFERRLRIASMVAAVSTAFFIYGSTAATARGDEVNLFFGVLRHHLFGLIILGGTLVLLAWRWRRWWGRLWGMGLVAIWVAVNLFTVNWRFNLEKPEAPLPFEPTGITQFLQTRLQSIGQVSPILRGHDVSNPQSFDSAQASSRGSARGDKSPISNLQSPPVGRIVSGGLLPGGNSAASVFNLPDLTGNTPLQIATVDTFFRRMPAWRLWQLMNVRYVVDNRDITGEGLLPVFEEGNLKVYEVGDPFPLVRFVSQVEVIPDDELATARLAADNFDLRRGAVLAQPLDTSLAGPSASTVTLVDFSPGRLKAVVETGGNQLLVFGQIYYPGWQAEIDGQPAELLRVNVIQQGIAVPAGKHSVQLRFSPASFRWGSIISAIGVLFWGAVMAIHRSKERKTHRRRWISALKCVTLCDG